MDIGKPILPKVPSYSLPRGLLIYADYLLASPFIGAVMSGRGDLHSTAYSDYKLLHLY